MNIQGPFPYRVPEALTSKEMRIEIVTSVHGPLAKLGMEPRLSAQVIHGDLADSSSSNGPEIRIESGSMEVVSTEIAPNDRARILDSVRKKLEPKRFPFISYRIEETTFDPASSPLTVRVRGTLTIMGISRPIDLRLEEIARKVFKSELRMNQTDFGIKPVSLLLGALRCEDEIRILIRIQLPEA